MLQDLYIDGSYNGFISVSKYWMSKFVCKSAYSLTIEMGFGVSPSVYDLILGVFSRSGIVMSMGFTVGLMCLLGNFLWTCFIAYYNL